ncbi:MAG: hypothetical protein DRP56_10050 [Planctomycetota bacterium]|nr:MAG: hypothetical protein DRP56_10050 [Planctomycetota bacterium]
MKKQTVLFFCVLLMVGSTALAAYTYKVDGYVYNRFSMSKVSGATVTFKVNYGTTTTTQSKTSKSDGSYAFTVTSVSNDPNGAAMSLTADTGSGEKGGIAWKAESYSERKDCPVDSFFMDPTLRFKSGTTKFSAPGVQPVDTAFLYRDDLAGPAWILLGYQMQLAFDPTKVQCNSVISAPGFPSFSPTIDNGAGTITINSGPADTPIGIGEEDFAVPLFDIEWDATDVETNAVTSLLVESSEFTIEEDGGPILVGPAVYNQSDHLLGEPDAPQPYFLISDFNDWDEGLIMEWPAETVSPVSEAQWEGHVDLWMTPDEIEGIPYFDPYPDTVFIPAEFPDGLYVYGGGPDGEPGNDPDPEDAGLVMKWGDTSVADGNYASAWHYDYGLDPDLSNCIIKITVTAPQFGAGGQINQVSFDIIDVNGGRTGWWWAVGTGNPIPWNTPITVTIDTTKTGIAATSPAATGWATVASAIGPFDIKKAQSFDVDENGSFVFGSILAPPPGSPPQFVGAWNYWHNLSVTPKTTAYKGSYVKYSQPPIVVEDDMIYGWDVNSVFPHDFDQGMTWTWAADDWRCYDERPITDVHWWGSFIGWTQPHLPPQVPDYFIMAIWKDVVADAATPSHPKELLWHHKCDKWVWNYAGYDLDPRFEFYEMQEYDLDRLGLPQENESCFQFNQLLSEDDWFYQEPMDVQEDGTVIPNVYWFSIAAVYELEQGEVIEYPWGWKTKPFDETKAPDAAVVITQLDQGTPPWETLTGTTTGHITEVVNYFPLILPDPSVYQPGVYDGWWDLAFELTTNEPKCPGLKADLNDDCIVNLPDFAIMADDWLKTSP